MANYENFETYELLDRLFEKAFVCEDDSVLELSRVLKVSPLTDEERASAFYARYSWKVKLSGKFAGHHYLTEADYERLGRECQLDLSGHYHNNEMVSIRSHITGRFFCADNAGEDEVRPIVANRDTVSDWEMFEVITNPDGTISLKAKANGKYLSALVNDGGILKASANAINEWEKFRVARRFVEDQHRMLVSMANAKIVSVDPETCCASATADASREWEWLTIAPCE